MPIMLPHRNLVKFLLMPNRSILWRGMGVHVAGPVTTTRYFFTGGPYEVEEVNDSGSVTQEVRRYYSIAGMWVAMKDASGNNPAV